MNLDLSPNEYLSTSRALLDTAFAYQGARVRGREDAHEEERKRKERTAQQAAALKRLRGQ